jgi:hypothetical protein
MAAERVVIDIEVNSDIATIEATREALERLTNAQKRYNRERDKEPRGGRGGGGGGGGGGDDDGRRRPRAPGVKGSGGGKGRYAGFAGQVFDFRGDAGKAIASYGALLKMVNKLSMISLPLLAGALGGISLAFQAGTYFIKMYRAAMASLTSAVGLAFVALTTFLAAQREFAVVQNSPQYAKATQSSSDRMVAAGEAMSMFVDNTDLAVIGAKGLQAAFTTLSKVKPVTGATVGAFTTLTDYVAGQGGDIEGNTKKLADFFAKLQKTGTVAGASAEAKALGPDFEKIVKEASALGFKTEEEFTKAALAGNLGETFATMYAGTLDSLNNTVMGRFKQATTAIKAQLTDLGGEYLSETGGAIVRLQGIIQTTIARLAYVLNDFDAAGKMGSFMDMVQKASDKLIVVMTKYLGTSPDLFEFFGNSFNSIANAFDAMQDWMRQFQAAGTMINEYFFKPLFNTLGQSFSDSMESLSNTISGNGPAIESFANAIAGVLTSIGKYGNEIRKLFIDALPVLTLLLKGVEMFFKGLGAFAQAASSIAKTLSKLGPLGKVAGGIVSVVALYSLFTIATRFFKTLGAMFGKNMKNSMTVNARVVNVNGSPMGGGGAGGGPMGRGGPRPAGSSGMGLFGRTKNAFMGAGRGGANLGGRLKAAGVAGSRQFGMYGANIASGAKGAFNAIGGLSGLGSMAAMAGGSYLYGKGDEAGGYNKAGGAAMKTAGLTAQVAGGAKMLGLGTKSVAPLAAATAAYGVSSYTSERFFKDDSVKSRAGSALVGAAGGAATGAAVGAIFAPFTAGLSVAAMAAIGGVVGGITGYFKAGKQRKNIRKAAEGLEEDFTSSVESAFEGGNVDDLLIARENLMKGQKELIETGGDAAYAQQALAKYNEQFEKLNSQIDNYTGTVALSEKFFGVGAEELNKLANAAGVDLKDKMLNFREVLNLVGKTAEDRARMVKLAWANIGSFAVSEVTSYFDKQQQAREQSKLVDADELRLAGGQTDMETQQSFLKNLLNFNVSKYGDTGGLANTGVALEKALAEGGRLSGLSDADKASLRGELLNAGATPEQVLQNVINSGGKNVLAELLGGSAGVPKSVMGADGKIDPTKLNAEALKRVQADPYFLANLAEAQRADTFTAPKQMPGKETAAVFSGAVPPASVVAPSYVSTTVNASILDYQTIRQIEAAVAKGLRDAKERGATASLGTEKK